MKIKEMAMKLELPEAIANMHESGTIKHLAEKFLPRLFGGFLESDTAGALDGHARGQAFADYQNLIRLINEVDSLAHYSNLFAELKSNHDN